jgi:hypothetical protein
MACFKCTIIYDEERVLIAYLSLAMACFKCTVIKDEDRIMIAYLSLARTNLKSRCDGPSRFVASKIAAVHGKRTFE